MKDEDAKAERALDFRLGTHFLCRTSEHTEAGETTEAHLKGKALCVRQKKITSWSMSE